MDARTKRAIAKLQLPNTCANCPLWNTITNQFSFSRCFAFYSSDICLMKYFNYLNSKSTSAAKNFEEERI